MVSYCTVSLRQLCKHQRQTEMILLLSKLQTPCVVNNSPLSSVTNTILLSNLITKSSRSKVSLFGIFCSCTNFVASEIYLLPLSLPAQHPNLPFAIFQRTTSPMAFPPLIWAPSLKLLKKAELPQCCALPVEIQTQRSRGSRTCFLWISAAATGASNSFAQVDFKMIWFNISKVWICVAYWECCKAAFTSLFPYHFFYSLSPLKAWMFYLSSLWLFAWILFVNFIGQIRTAATLKVTRMLE